MVHMRGDEHYLRSPCLSASSFIRTLQHFLNGRLYEEPAVHHLWSSCSKSRAALELEPRLPRPLVAGASSGSPILRRVYILK